MKENSSSSSSSGASSDDEQGLALEKQDAATDRKEMRRRIEKFGIFSSGLMAGLENQRSARSFHSKKR
jgi:hypothetical protein